MPLSDKERLLIALLAKVAMMPDVHPSRVLVEKGDGLAYEWTGKDAEVISAVIGRAILNGEELPKPRSVRVAELVLEEVH